MSKKPGLSDESLRYCLAEQYALNAAILELLSQGLDVNARVYRVVSEQGDAYLLKAKQGPLYEQPIACRVISGTRESHRWSLPYL